MMEEDDEQASQETEVRPSPKISLRPSPQTPPRKLSRGFSVPSAGLRSSYTTRTSGVTMQQQQQQPLHGEQGGQPAPLKEWEADEFELLRWSTPARRRDVEQTQRRLAYKAYLESQDYEPYAHRQEAFLTNMGAAMQLINGILPIALMGTARFFAFVGMAPGIVGLPIMAAITCYCCYMSLRNEYAICCAAKEPYMGMPRVVEFACRQGPHKIRPAAPFLRYWALSFSVIRSCFIVGYNCWAVGSVANTWLKNLFGQQEDWVIFLTIAPFVLLICAYMDVNYVVPVATVGNLTSLISTILSVVCVIQQEWGKGASIKAAEFTIDGFPMYVFGTMYALNNVPVFQYTEKLMKRPQDLVKPWGVLPRTMTYIIMILVLLGITGYAGFGEDNKSKKTFGLLINEDYLSANILFGTLLATRYFSISVNVYVMHDVIWEAKLKSMLRGYPKGHQVFAGVLVRIVFVFICLSLAAALPHYGEYDELTSAITVPTLTLVFPAFIELCLCWKLKNFGRFHYVFVKCCIMIIFALYCTIFGLIETIKLIKNPAS